MTQDIVLPTLLIGIALVLGYFSFHAFFNRMRLRGWVAGFGALALAATTVFAVWPALQSQKSAGDADRLRGELAVVSAIRDKIAAENGGLKAVADRLASEVASANRAQAEQLAALQTEIDRTTTVVTAARSGLVLDAPTQPTTTAPFDRALTSIKGLSTLRARELSVAVRSVDQTRDLLQLRDKMAARMSTPAYDVEVYPDNELVGGRVGKYYIVDLKDASNGVRYYFDGGRYTLARGDAEFRSSLNAFIGDVLGKMQNNVRYSLFVRGSADQKPYEGRLEPGQEITQIKYLRALGNDKYAKDFVEQRMDGGVVRNKDLPNLRAAFLKNLITDIYPVKPPEILEGAVTPVTRDKDRNAELILFVEW